MIEATKQSVSARLKRIEGQVRGIARMVDEDRYCVDVLTQVDAARAALLKVEEEILRDHVSHCVSHAFASGNTRDQREKIDELVGVMAKMRR
jgi:DNA-binding FrmR family transcriptional regulator